MRRVVSKVGSISQGGVVMRKTALLLVLGVVLGCLIVSGFQKGAVAQAPGPKGEVPIKLLPGLKVGDRVVFGGHSVSQSRWKFTDGDKSPVVFAIQGKWVQLQGIEPEGHS